MLRPLPRDLYAVNITNMDEVEEVKDEEWDYYSGLPNPMWYADLQD